MRPLVMGSVVLGLLGLLVMPACAPPTGGASDPAAAQEVTPGTPFAGDGIKAESSGLEPAAAHDTTKNHLPFHDSGLPAGTLLSVRLISPVRSGDLGKNPSQEATPLEARTFEATPFQAMTFQATVDEPVVVRGDTVIPRGAVVDGRVESVRASDVKPSRGYVRLALASIRIDGLEVPVETSSLFVREVPSADGSSPEIDLEKGRRLTFRLTNPVYLSAQSTQSAQSAQQTASGR